MNRKIYIQSVINALQDYKDLLNISELEKKTNIPDNALRKVLNGSRQMSVYEANKIASVLHGLAFRFSHLNLTDQQLSTLF